MRLHTPILTGGNIVLKSVQRDYLAKFVGKEVVLSINEDINQELRAFFEGAVVPYYFYQNPKAGWTNFRDCREALKLEYNPLYIIGIDGTSQAIPKSTTGSKRAFQELLERVQHGFMENGFEFPNSEEYKQWRDSGVGVDEVYPPLLKLKELYEELKKQSLPVWHQNK